MVGATSGGFSLGRSAASILVANIRAAALSDFDRIAQDGYGFSNESPPLTIEEQKDYVRR